MLHDRNLLVALFYLPRNGVWLFRSNVGRKTYKNTAPVRFTYRDRIASNPPMVERHFMNQQIWFCLICRRCGFVEFAPGTDAYAVITMIREAHQRARTHELTGPCVADPQVINV